MVLNWSENVRAVESALPRKLTGRPKNNRTPGNVATLRASIEQSPRHYSDFGQVEELLTALNRKIWREICSEDLWFQ